MAQCFDEISSDGDLDIVLEHTVNIMDHIREFLFTEEERNRISTISIEWSDRRTYNLLGQYFWNRNEIQISRIFIGQPAYVLAAVVWHELLHIHFNRNNGRRSHSAEFRLYDRKYPLYQDAYARIHELTTAWRRERAFKAIIAELLQNGSDGVLIRGISKGNWIKIVIGKNREIKVPKIVCEKRN